MNPPTETNPPTATGINDLPPEMICELFEYLHPKDLAACSLVNKRWHSIYAGFKVHRLISIDYSGHHTVDPIEWYGTKQPVVEAERCRPAMFGRLVEKPLLSNLKYLALCGPQPEFDLNSLNQFEKLVLLHVDIGSRKKEVHLNLPKLKVLVFDNINKHNLLSIDCPELSTLFYLEMEGLNLLDVKHPETIRKLDVDMIGPQLAPFKGVECLVTEQFAAISQATLRQLPRLRELRFIEPIDYFLEVSSNRAGTVDRMKRTLSEFMDEAKKLRGSDFQFSFCGFQLAKVGVEQIDFGVQVDEETGAERVCNEYVYMKNYHLIEPGALKVYCIDYTRLMSNITGEFPRCFSQKFTGIEKVVAKAEVQDVDQFLWFLKSVVRYLKCLELASAAFNQEFYDQLPASVRSLGWLYLDGAYESELQLNFDFIEEFSSSLSCLAISQPVSLKSIPSLMRSAGRLANCNFFVGSKKKGLFLIRKVEPTEWQVHGATEIKTNDPEEIVNFFEGLQNEASSESDWSESD